MTEALRMSGNILESARVRFASAAASPTPLQEISLMESSSLGGTAQGAPPRRHRSITPPENAAQGPPNSEGSWQPSAAAPLEAAPTAADQTSQHQAPGLVKRGDFQEEELRALRMRLGRRGGAQGAPSLTAAVRSQRDRQLECVAIVTTLQKAAEAAEGETQELPEYLTKPTSVQLGLKQDTEPLEQKRLQQLKEQLKKSITSEAQRAAAERRYVGRAVGIGEDIQARTRDRAHANFPDIRQAEGRAIGKPEFLEGWAEPLPASLSVSGSQKEPPCLVANAPHNVVASWLRTKPSKTQEDLLQAENGSAQTNSETSPQSFVELLCSLALEQAPQIQVIREGKMGAIVKALEFENSVPPPVFHRKKKPSVEAAVQTAAPTDTQLPSKPARKTAVPRSEPKSSSSSTGSDSGSSGTHRSHDGVWLSSTSSEPSASSSTSDSSDAEAAEKSQLPVASHVSSSGSSGSEDEHATPEERTLKQWERALEVYVQQFYKPLVDIMQGLPQRFLPPLNPSASNELERFGARQLAGEGTDFLSALGRGKHASALLQEQLATNPFLFLLQEPYGWQAGTLKQEANIASLVLPALGGAAAEKTSQEAESTDKVLENTMTLLFGPDYCKYFGGTSDATPVLELSDALKACGGEAACQQQSPEQLMEQYQQQMLWSGRRSSSSRRSGSSTNSRWGRQVRRMLPVLETVGRRQHLPLTRGGRRMCKAPPECLRGGSGDRIEYVMNTGIGSIGSWERVFVREFLRFSMFRKLLSSFSQESMAFVSSRACWCCDWRVGGGGCTATHAALHFYRSGASKGGGKQNVGSRKPRQSLRGRRRALRPLDVAAEEERLSPLEVRRRLGLKTRASLEDVSHARYADVMRPEVTVEEAAAAAASERRRKTRLRGQLAGLLRCAEQEVSLERGEGKTPQHLGVRIQAALGKMLETRNALAKAKHLKSRLAASDKLLAVQRTVGMIAAQQRTPTLTDAAEALQAHQEHVRLQQQKLSGKRKDGAKKQAAAEPQPAQQQSPKHRKQQKSIGRVLFKATEAASAVGSSAQKDTPQQLLPSKEEGVQRTRPALAKPTPKGASSAAAGASDITSKTDASLLPDIAQLCRTAGMGRPVSKGKSAAGVARAEAATSAATELLEQLPPASAALVSHRPFDWEEQPIPTLRPHRRLEEMAEQLLQAHGSPRQQQQHAHQNSAAAAAAAFAASSCFSWENEVIPTHKERGGAAGMRKEEHQAPRQQPSPPPPAELADLAGGAAPSEACESTTARYTVQKDSL
ncbi:uncharacterized protein LOC34618235 [Cyclospora cayetanensis]|uniref:Uncharacterized protein LOC34618235 n=1 Tax=Cyclospora cayetanensis TaxID=88456 RepID=A0A6P6RZF3_9EIME|nr:uncharacterized protein LOC34618235 [Cyclospora cayetanensis]